MQTRFADTAQHPDAFFVFRTISSIACLYFYIFAQAKWEIDNSHQMNFFRMKDWSEFANVVGYKEIPRLKKMGIHYRIPPPGVE